MHGAPAGVAHDTRVGTKEALYQPVRHLSTMARGVLKALHMELTVAMLQEISFQISEGNPWWGLLLANEYLSPHELLHQALYQRAMTRLGGSAAKHPLAKKLRRGYRASMLPEELRRHAGQRCLRHVASLGTSFVPMPRTARASTRRQRTERRLPSRPRAFHFPLPAEAHNRKRLSSRSIQPVAAP